MAKILGLDLGTNSIGWALVEQNTQGQKSIFHTLTSEAGLRLKNNGPHELGSYILLKYA